MNQLVTEQHLKELMQLLLSSPDEHPLILQKAESQTVGGLPTPERLKEVLAHAVENAGSLEVRTKLKKTYCDGVALIYYICYPVLCGVAYTNSFVTVRKVTLSAVRGRKTSTSIYDDPIPDSRSPRAYIKAVVMLASMIAEMSKR